MKRIQKIALVSLNPRFPDYIHRAVMCENALPTIGTVLRNHGYDVEVFMERIAPIPWDRVLQADLVGFSAVTCTAKPAYEMVARIKNCRDIPTVLGGPHASVLTDDAIQHFDYVVRDEGEETFLDLLDVLNKGGNVDSVKGISYLKDGQPHHNLRRDFVREFETIADLSLVYGYEKLSPFKVLMSGRYHVHFLETSRGCPYPCKFCWRIGMKTFRCRSSEGAIQDVAKKIDFFRGYPNTIIILDSYFGVKKERTKEFLKAVIDSNLKAFYMVFARCEIAEDLELLELMRRAGVKWVFVGVESVNNRNLEFLAKKQKIQRVGKALDTIHQYGMHVTASIILGSDMDTKDGWLKGVKFAREHNITWVMFNALSEFPNGQGQMIPLWRIFQRDWDYYNGFFVTFYPRKMKPSELQKQVIDAYSMFFSWKDILRNVIRGRFAQAFYRVYQRYAMTSILREMKAYIPYLKEIEKGLYDELGCLIEEKLLPPFSGNGKETLIKEIA